MLSNAQIEVAIIGGGIAGVTAALGLLRRGISVKVYERASGFREIGAGIGLSPNAERAMLLLNPDIHAVFKRLATPNTEDWFQYVDGFNRSQQGDGEDLLFKVYLGERGFEGCRRTDFLDELVSLLPAGCVEFRKELVDITEPEDETSPVALYFADGSMAYADAVLGCDGLRSRVREYILGVDHPAVEPSYTHKFAYRGVIPMKDAIQAIGEGKALTRYMHLGPECHVLTFPVSMSTMLNVVAFVTDPNEWPSLDQTTLPATREEVLESFRNFGPVVKESPVASYVSPRGCVCLVGDAAHAAAPHHGAGAGSAIEDALALAVGLEEAVKILTAGLESISRRKVISAAFAAYECTRYDRTQWIIESSRFMGELFEWQAAGFERDPDKCHSEVEWRSHKIWDYDVENMIKEVRESFVTKVSES